MSYQILETSKPKNLLIEEKDSIFISHKEKESLKNKKVDSIEVEGFNRPENNIKNIDKIEILKPEDDKINMLKSLKGENKIEPRGKKPLWNINELLIEREEKPQNEIVNIDKINLLGNTPNPKLWDENII